MHSTVSTLPSTIGGRLPRAATALLLGLLSLLPAALPVWAADVTPVLEARALLGQNVRPGSWAAVSVRISNDGPSLSGELRIRSSQQGRSQYGLAVELPNGARQEHVLYVQPPLFGSRLHVDLVSGGQTVVTQEVRIKTHDAWAPIIAIVAERPERIQPALSEVARDARDQAASVITLTPADLPPRPEAWSAIDRLVWQDIDSARLTSEQQAALRQWLGAGGKLVVVAGTAGLAPLLGFADELLPYSPTHTINVQPAELSGFLGQLPADATVTPAVTGTLRGGTVLARAGNGDVIAAQASWGQGSVTLVGFNPAERWLAESSAAAAFWRRAVPLGAGPFLNPLAIPDDSALVQALNNLPAIDLPPIGQLFILLFAYVALIGPINYLVLRRLDKREWAWFTMPALVAVFTVVSYGLGANLKGSDVIVNQVAIVRAGQNTGEGLGQVYVGVFSPTRRSFDVRVPGGALLSNPTSQFQFGQAEQGLDILFGDPARLRNFEVGFGVLRGFRAEAATEAPIIESSLKLVRGRLEGTVTNRSEAALENVAVLFGSGVAVLTDLEPDETRTIALDTTTGNVFGHVLSERIFGSSFPRDRSEARVLYTRRTVVDQLTNFGPSVGVLASDRPLLLGWQRGPVLDVELTGERPNRVGDSLFMVPLAVSHDRQAVFADQLLSKTITEASGLSWGDATSGFALTRGTAVVETQPRNLEGRFAVTSLELALTQGETRTLNGRGQAIAPLPDDQQPPQDDPLGEPPDPNAEPRFEEMPDIQLWDHDAARWLEFPRLSTSRSYLVSDPGRFVDGSGRLLARFVNRGGIHEEKWLTFAVRLEGTID